MPSSWQELQGLHGAAQQMNPSGRCTVQPSLLPRGEVILEGILFIQEIFLEIFTCQDYMFKFFDKASSGPLAEFLRSFASISVGFSTDKRHHHSGETTVPFSKTKEMKLCVGDSSLSRRLQFLFCAKTRNGSHFLRMGSGPCIQSLFTKYSAIPAQERECLPARAPTSSWGSPGKPHLPQAWLIF